jgi:predicted TIM-barrel fold metal-dependent hydrolase
VAETLAYYIPGVDHALDVVASPATLAAGVVASAAVMTDIPPEVMWPVAVIAGDESPAALHALSAGGTVGIRLQAVGPTRPALARLEVLARRADEQGWHLQLHLDADLIVEAATRLAALDVDLVFDHFGRIPYPDGAGHPAFGVMASLVARGRTWVKLSAGYHFTRSGGPEYDDVGALTRAFLALAPERMLWGSDWPHPTEAHKPDSGVMLDRFAEWAADDATRRRVLVDNPTELYGFPTRTA